MKFSNYVRARIAERLKQAQVLSVFDPTGDFAPICLALQADLCTVVDTRGCSSLEARAAVIAQWAVVRCNPDAHLLIYRSAAAPIQDGDLLSDLLAPFVVIGDVFPRPGVAGDSHYDLAIGAYPTQQVEVAKLFAAGIPTFAALDSLGAGTVWPVLAAATGQEGAVAIICALVQHDSKALEQVVANASGCAELQRFLAINLEYQTTAVPAAAEVRSQLWKRLLISEFLLDLPGGVPTALAAVPHTSAACQPLVYQVCKRLRLECPAVYIEQATALANELQLDSLARQIDSFGQIDTFALESAAALREAVAAIEGGNLARVEELIKQATHSLWYSDAGTLQRPWQIIRSALTCVECLEKAGPAPSAGDLVGWYQRLGYAVDGSYRGFVSIAADRDEDEPWGVPFGNLDAHLAQRYRAWVDVLQKVLVGRVKQDGWPWPGLRRQDRVFDDYVAIHFQQGKRVMYLLVDALRYELAQALSDKLQPKHQTSLEAVGALLPTKTRLGMAALTPAAAGALQVTVTADDWFVARGTTLLKTADDRDKCYAAIKGDQCLVERLDTWNVRTKKSKLASIVDLIVVRSTEIDMVGESGSDVVFRAVIEKLVNGMTKAITKAFDLGIDVVVVSADHGFLYLPQQAVGDQVSPPHHGHGTKQARYAIGKFDAADHLLEFDAAALGYLLPEARVLVPQTIGSFTKPGFYAHGGLSIQEALVPVLTVTRSQTATTAKPLSVSMTYKSAQLVMRSLRPVVTITVANHGQLDFDEDWVTQSVRIRLSIITAADGAEAGSLAANSYLDSDTGTLVIPEGTVAPIPLKISEAVREPIIVRAQDADTDLTYAELRFEIEITE